MAPAWRELGDAYAADDAILIGEVDCTSELGKQNCRLRGVQAYPTLKFLQAGDSELQEYDESEHSFEALDAFTKENVGPACIASHQATCSEEQKEALQVL